MAFLVAGCLHKGFATWKGLTVRVGGLLEGVELQMFR